MHPAGPSAVRVASDVDMLASSASPRSMPNDLVIVGEEAGVSNPVEDGVTSTSSISNPEVRSPVLVVVRPTAVVAVAAEDSDVTVGV